jgi:hypothetical protein
MVLPSCKQDTCEELRKEKLEINFDDMSGAQAHMSRIQACGFDSVDCILAFYIVGEICTQKEISSGTLNINNRTCTIPFGDVIDRFNKFKQTSTYKEERENVIKAQR